jgi:hypothetical protein
VAMISAPDYQLNLVQRTEDLLTKSGKEFSRFEKTMTDDTVAIRINFDETTIWIYIDGAEITFNNDKTKAFIYEMYGFKSRTYEEMAQKFLSDLERLLGG